MTHLGDQLAAFVDGELSHDARDRVLAHLAGCAECRAAADAERVVKAGLAAIDGPLPSFDLTRRLLALAEPGEPLPPRRHLVDKSTAPPSVPVGTWATSGPTGGRLPGARPTATPPPTAPSRRRPGTLRRHVRLQVAAAGLGAAAMALGAAVAIGGNDQPGPAVGPGDDWFAVQHAATTGGVPLVDPAMSMTVGFAGTGGITGTATSGSAGGGTPFSGAYFGGVSAR